MAVSPSSLAVHAGLDPDTVRTARLPGDWRSTEGRWVLSEDDPDAGEWGWPSPPPDGTYQAVLGDPGEVVLTLMPGGCIEIAEFSLVWMGQTPVPLRRRYGRVLIEPGGAKERTQMVVEAVRAIRRRRRRHKFRRCIECNRMTPPEWWFGEGICQSCAEHNHGVVV